MELEEPLYFATKLSLAQDGEKKGPLSSTIDFCSSSRNISGVFQPSENTLSLTKNYSNLLKRNCCFQVSKNTRSFFYAIVITYFPVPLSPFRKCVIIVRSLGSK